MVSLELPTFITSLFTTIQDFFILILLVIYVVMFFVVQYYLIKAYIFIFKTVWSFPLVSVPVSNLLKEHLNIDVNKKEMVTKKNNNYLDEEL